MECSGFGRHSITGGTVNNGYQPGGNGRFTVVGSQHWLTIMEQVSTSATMVMAHNTTTPQNSNSINVTVIWSCLRHNGQGIIAVS